MRLFSRPRQRPLVPLCLAAAAALAAAQAPAHADPDPAAAPACAASDARAFPLTTRIHGGPDAYAAGGGFGTWYVDLTNTTDRPCTGVHPVIVLVDEERALKPSQPRLEFYDGSGEPPRPVRFEATEADELVGAFDDGFAGFTIGPRETVSVKVRLALTSDAVVNRVTAAAAVVQRRDDDGEWIGQSNDYRFHIDAEPGRTAHPEADSDSDADTDTDATTEAAPDPEASAAATPGTADPAASATPRDEITRPGRPEELAVTGLTPLARGGLAATAVLLLAGAVLFRARRRS
ncbi:hypothetical protein ACWC10_37535 [Streptomyces sp. NPDC001595]|uniref:hypothetical protein n=1 Tax=Streptomyces sp. NPDC001532 TaxID=3154520 RepID=UPI003320E53F